MRKKTCAIVYSFDCEDHSLHATKSSQIYLSTSAPGLVWRLVHAEKSTQHDIAFSESLNSSTEAEKKIQLIVQRTHSNTRLFSVYLLVNPADRH